MINEAELPVYIKHTIPALSDVCKKEKKGNAYRLVRHLLKHTILQVEKHNLAAAKQCMALAGQLYKKGNAVIKNAIENVYVFSFSHAFFYDEHERKELQDIVPASLYQLYRKQLVNSHL